MCTLYAVFLWRRGFRQHNRVSYFLLLLGFVFHTLAIVGRGFSFSRCPVNNLYEAIAFVSWTIAASYLVIGAWPRFQSLGVFAAPMLFGIGVFALMPDLDPPFTGKPHFVGGWTSFHAASILLAYGAFGLSTAAGLMYLTQERDLKLHRLRAVLSLMPPIQRLELIVTRVMLAGFILLTVGLTIGGYNLKRTQIEFYRSDPKILWSAIVWMVYLGLLLMRWKFAQTGRRFVWGVVGTFAFVLLTFWGTNLLSGIHQQ
ncbi:MAG: cytochrome c biogenesis protein CcsA [Verrucomicrobia bacterium]|nr:cytochrome c biogenesis protein CcsA [Verrucomicrobiota bacterium]